MWGRERAPRRGGRRPAPYLARAGADRLVCKLYGRPLRGDSKLGQSPCRGQRTGGPTTPCRITGDATLENNDEPRAKNGKIKNSKNRKTLTPVGQTRFQEEPAETSLGANDESTARKNDNREKPQTLKLTHRKAERAPSATRRKRHRLRHGKPNYENKNVF